VTQPRPLPLVPLFAAFATLGNRSTRRRECCDAARRPITPGEIGACTVSTSTPTATVWRSNNVLYQLIRQSGPIGKRRFGIESPMRALKRSDSHSPSGQRKHRCSSTHPILTTSAEIVHLRRIRLARTQQLEVRRVRANAGWQRAERHGTHHPSPVHRLVNARARSLRDAADSIETSSPHPATKPLLQSRPVCAG
jgi:hypothetical protein